MDNQPEKYSSPSLAKANTIPMPIEVATLEQILIGPLVSQILHGLYFAGSTTTTPPMAGSDTPTDTDTDTTDTPTTPTIMIANAGRDAPTTPTIMIANAGRDAGLVVGGLFLGIGAVILIAGLIIIILFVCGIRIQFIRGRQKTKPSPPEKSVQMLKEPSFELKK